MSCEECPEQYTSGYGDGYDAGALAHEDLLNTLMILAKEGMHSREMFMSNPPKNVVAYRLWSLLKDAGVADAV